MLAGSEPIGKREIEKLLIILDGPSQPCRRLQIGVFKMSGQNRMVARPLLCKCWRCAGCVPFLKRMHAMHIASKIVLATGTLAFRISQPETWERDYKRLEREGADYCRIGCGDHPGLVILERPRVDPRDTVLSDKKLAISKVVESIRNLNLETTRRRIRPISYSKNWRLPEREENADFVGVSQLSSLPDFVRNLIDHDADPRFLQRDGGFEVRFGFNDSKW